MSIANIDELASASVSYGLSALVLTDFKNLYGVPDLIKACRKYRLKPIIGCVFPLNLGIKSRSNFLLERHGLGVNLVLLAESMQGYQNLLQLLGQLKASSRLSGEGLDLGQLAGYSDGLIALIGGGIWGKFLIDEAEAISLELVFKKLLAIFGVDFLRIELQDYGLTWQHNLHTILYAVSQKLNIPLVVTHEVRFVSVYDFFAYSLFSQDRPNLNHHCSFLSSHAMEEHWHKWSFAVQETMAIVNRCCSGFDFFAPVVFNLPHDCLSDRTGLLKKMIDDGVKRRYNYPLSLNVSQRLAKEWDIIQQKDLISYLLLVAELVQYARKKKITIGPGRGSAVGSLVVYALGITDVDPLAHNLLFERFLHMDRAGFPDIDLDVSGSQRSDILHYLKKKYGEGHVAQIATFARWTVKALLKFLASKLDLKEVNLRYLLSLLPQENLSFDKIIREHPVLREHLKSAHPRLLSILALCTGMPRQVSTHAAGIIITKQPLISHIPLDHGTYQMLRSQYDMYFLKQMNLLKLDLLALNQLNVLGSLESVIPDMGIMEKDKVTFDLLSRGDTIALFQLESQGMRTLLKSVKPQKMSELMDILALYRPGTKKYIYRYLQSKGDDFFTHIAGMRDILSGTRGVLLYQEQVMQIAVDIAGFSWELADKLQMAISKNEIDNFTLLKEPFVSGCMAKGLSFEQASNCYEAIGNHLGFVFNRSHVSAYATLVLKLAYVKANYPLLFWVANLQEAMGDRKRLALFVSSLKQQKIKILIPDLRFSDHNFTVEKKHIRTGLGSISGVNKHLFQHLRPMPTNWCDFLDDICKNFSKAQVVTSLVSLASVGVFSLLPGHRAQQVQSLQIWQKSACFSLIDTTPWSRIQLQEVEQTILGFNAHLPALYLRLTSEKEQTDILKKLKKILQTYIGDYDVYLFYERTGRYIKLAADNYRVQFHPDLFSNLKNLLGNDSVHEGISL